MVHCRKRCVEGGLAATGHCTPTLLVICGVFSLSGISSWGVQAKELSWKSACEGEILNVDCSSGSVIALHEATFTSDIAQVKNSSCYVSEEEEEAKVLSVNGTCQEDIRIPVNRRCSGLENCNFSYSQLQGRKCDGNNGVVNIRYDCVEESSIYKYCNVQIRSKEGYISSPGYPEYYPDLPKCEWEIQAGDGQTVIFHLLDIHMRSAVERYGRHHCDDAITVLEGNTRRLMLCGDEAETLQSLEADVDSGLVIQFTSQSFYPGSGFLLYFKVQGCSTLPPPKDGYLVHRNGSTATYLCCQKYLFNDTLESSRTLQCVGDHHWNDTLAPCVAVEELKQIYVNHTIEVAEFEEEINNVTVMQEKPNILEAKASYMEDILVPSILMAVLILGNAFIVAIILRIRKKQKAKLELEDDDLSPERSIPEATNV